MSIGSVETQASGSQRFMHFPGRNLLLLVVLAGSLIADVQSVVMPTEIGVFIVKVAVGGAKSYEGKFT